MKASILSKNWYESRTVLRVGRWSRLCYKTEGVTHPLWVLEGICCMLRLTNKEWHIKQNDIKEYE